HGHDDHAHGDHGHGEAPHGSLRGYMTGFILSVILTAIPFALVMTGKLDGTTTAVIVLAMAAIQVVVHMVFFLHMTTTAEGGWSFLALLF
ncbi:cytochrome o ubiquinol oxidase subunit IV, partial [Pseudomonas sp. GW456-11-11-14-TSB2]|uniref:cytochrome o ubiquinol oxidase subunit IV n=1 Tax=Pseudomonas sp. GW456-11-11-14-TSB2 TaxID=2751348 RepID=UPI000CC008D1